MTSDLKPIVHYSYFLILDDSLTPFKHKQGKYIYFPKDVKVVLFGFCYLADKHTHNVYMMFVTVMPISMKTSFLYKK